MVKITANETLVERFGGALERLADAPSYRSASTMTVPA